MARTKDPSAATRKAWITRHRNAQGGGSDSTTSRGDYAREASQSRDWADAISESHRTDAEDKATRNRIKTELEGLSPEHRTAMIKYAAHGFIDLNDGLRRDRGVPQLPRLMAAVDAVFEAGVLKTDKVESVYRGMDRALLDLEPGDEIHDKGYVSTSLSPEIAREFAGQNHEPYRQQVILRINLPKGTTYGPGEAREHEFVLNRGSRFRVLRAARDSKGRTVYDMEVLS